jgi:hypothetical protein
MPKFGGQIQSLNVGDLIFVVSRGTKSASRTPYRVTRKDEYKVDCVEQFAGVPFDSPYYEAIGDNLVPWDE